MAKNKKVKPHLTDKQKKKIKADYIETGLLRETARRNNVSTYAVKKIIDEVDDLQQKITEKQQENSKDILEYMDKKKEDTQRVLDKLLNGIEVKADELDMFTDIKGLATAYGIILDKQLKILELQRGMANTDQISKVQELLNKLDDEAKK